MKVYKKIMDGLAMIEKVILSVITVVVTVVTFANVVVRYASDSQFAWSEELVINLFVLMIMMGCALCARDGSLISLSLIFDFLKVKGKKIFVAIATVVNCVFYGVLLYTGWEKVLSQMASGKHTYSLNWPEWVFSIFLPIGAVLLIIHTIEYFIDVMSNNAACVKIEEGEEENND